MAESRWAASRFSNTGRLWAHLPAMPPRAGCLQGANSHLPPPPANHKPSIVHGVPANAKALIQANRCADVRHDWQGTHRSEHPRPTADAGGVVAAGLETPAPRRASCPPPRRQGRDAPESSIVRSAGLPPALRVHSDQTAGKQPLGASIGSGKPVTDRCSGGSVECTPPANLCDSALTFAPANENFNAASRKMFC